MTGPPASMGRRCVPSGPDVRLARRGRGPRRGRLHLRRRPGRHGFARRRSHPSTPSASVAAEPADSAWSEPTDVMGAPNLASEPDPALAPQGVDLRPLRSPPDLQPAADRSRPFDPAAGIMNLDHLVFIVLENRSFDHYFGTFPGADGIPMDAKGRPKVCLRRPGAARHVPPPLPRHQLHRSGRAARRARQPALDRRRRDGRLRGSQARRSATGATSTPTRSRAPRRSTGPRASPT